MNKVSEKIDQLSEKVGFKFLLVTAVLWLTFIVLSVVICMGKVSSEVGMQVFDLKTFGYSVKYVSDFLVNASQDIRDFYMYVGIPVDFFLAFFLGAFPIVVYLYYKKSINVPNFLIFLSLGIWVFDSIENILLLNILDGSYTTGLVTFASTVTIIKNICMIPTYVILIFYTVKYNKEK